MQRVLLLLLLLCGLPGTALSGDAAPQPILPDAVPWSGLPNDPAVQAAWLLGSEQAAEPYVLRVKLATGGRLPPHAHPDERNSTVLSGTLYVGFGDVFDESQVVAVPAGAIYVAPANVMHYVWAKDGAVEYQETGIGPTRSMKTVAPPSQAAQATGLAALAWLAGCWGSESGEAGTGETWLPPAGGSMLGVERTIENGKRVSYGFMRIETNAEESCTFIALPSGQQETSFPVLSLSTGSVTFENLQHDFPQRVIYRSLPGDRLFARIEGKDDGVEQGIDFPMKRISCESPDRAV